MKRFSGAIRWIARILGLLAIVLFAPFAIGEGFPRLAEFTTAELIMFAGVFTMILGALAAWKWDVAGALIIFAGFAANWIADTQYPAGSLGLFPLAGFLYLIAWMLQHQPKPFVAPIENKKPGKKKKRGRVSKA